MHILEKEQENIFATIKDKNFKNECTWRKAKRRSNKENKNGKSQIIWKAGENQYLTN